MMFNHIFGNGSAQAANSGVSQISVVELARKRATRESIQLIDVRSPEEFQLDGHIAGARLLPLHALAQRLTEITRDTPIVLICRSGNRSQVAAELLERQGYRDISNVQGGMTAWRRAGLPTE
jgi:rhodanese-related sulfurtransferase